MAADMLSFYSGDKPGGTVGLLPQPYYCKHHFPFTFTFFLLSNVIC